ncbi:MAG: DUF4112 domain-containing protein [Chthoniobacterales bacterium]
MKKAAKAVEWEVLPAETEATRRQQAIPRIVALLMDNLFRIPGTQRRFGLNPLLDLIPAVGDASAATISAATLFVAARSGVPKVVMARMGMNILLNALIGIIPGIGEVFAFWFRPSNRNYELLKKHSASAVRPSTRGDKIFVFGIVGAILLLFAGLTLAGMFVMFLLARTLFPHR